MALDHILAKGEKADKGSALFAVSRARGARSAERAWGAGCKTVKRSRTVLVFILNGGINVLIGLGVFPGGLINRHDMNIIALCAVGREDRFLPSGEGAGEKAPPMTFVIWKSFFDSSSQA